MGAYDKGVRDGGFGLRIFYGITPETEETTWFFWSTANGHRQNDPEATEQLFRSIEEAFKEDDHVLEAQQQTLVAPRRSPPDQHRFRCCTCSCAQRA